MSLVEATMRALGPLAVPWCVRPLADLPDARSWEEATAPAELERWLGDLRAGMRLPPAVAGTFLTGWLAGAALGPAVAMIAGCARAPDVAPATLHLSRHPDGWVRAVAMAPACAWVCGYDPRRADPSALPVAGRDAVVRRFCIGAADCVGPVVDAVCALTPLGRRAVLGAVADAAHAGMGPAVAAGADGDEARRLWWAASAVVDGLARNVPGGMPVRPRLVGTGAGAPPGVVRGTCCLAYRTDAARERAADGHETRCATCPLRAADER